MARSASEVPLLPLLKLNSSKKLVEGHQQDDATFVRTCFNGLNALTGVGLLSIPYALSQGGWLSLLLLFIVAMICCYTGLLLQRCMNADPRIRTYSDIGEFAFGYSGRIFVSIFMYLELYLVAIGFLILEGDNLDKLFPDTKLIVGTVSIASKQLFVMLVALIILPTTWLRSLSVLAYVSAGGVLASVIVVFSVLWAATVDGVGFGERGRFLNLSGLPTTLGLYTFCYGGHAVLPTLCTSMKDKSKFSKVLLLCFITCTLNYGSMAILGYLMYGDSVNSQVTLNLPTGKLSSKVAIYTTLINPFSKYALMIAPVATAIEERLITVNKRSATLLIRSLVVLSTVVIALTIPFFGSLMALIGSLLSIIVSMMLPCICYIKIFGASQVRKVELVLISGILLTGTLVAVTGTYASLMEIIHQF
uniref:Amino acid transporter transmembrane domain-containing protein n=1 Tax=Ananas comosus var. bracteatus TaxID=296719 RepID=A0A6V7P6N2_ANACO|nr:unnamed protein product [Ananas comosus var. bracteatus]